MVAQASGSLGASRERDPSLTGATSALRVSGQQSGGGGPNLGFRGLSKDRGGDLGADGGSGVIGEVRELSQQHKGALPSLSSYTVA